MKITQRDKMLLILLAIIFVVAIAYILPGYGISAAMEKKSTYLDKLSEQKSENSEQLRELIKMGVEPNLAEKPVLANERLNKRILQLKEEASRLAGNILEYTKTYGVDEKWIDGLEYRYGMESDDSEILINYDKSQDVSGEINGEVTYEDTAKGVSYTIKSAKRSINFTVAATADCNLAVEMTAEGCNLPNMGALVLFLEHLTAKGSLLIDSVTYSTKDNGGSINFTVLMTETDGISTYARELAALQEEEEE